MRQAVAEMAVADAVRPPGPEVVPSANPLRDQIARVKAERAIPADQPLFRDSGSLPTFAADDPRPDVSFGAADIERVVWHDAWCECGHREAVCNSYCETGSAVILELKSGRYVYAREVSDTTGHGCQCSGSMEQFDDLESLIACGLDNENRERVVKEMAASA